MEFITHGMLECIIHGMLELFTLMNIRYFAENKRVLVGGVNRRVGAELSLSLMVEL